MGEIRRVGVLGVGAIGAYFVWGLSEKLGDDLVVIAEGERAERLRANGIVINGERWALNVCTPEEARDLDLLLVAVKGTALEGCLDAIERATSEGTTVLSLLNGVSSERVIGERIGGQHLVYSFMRIASQRAGSSVTFDGPASPGLFFGEPGYAEPTPRCAAIASLLDDTPLNYRFCPDILHEMWDKFALNVSKNLPQAILGVGAGAYDDSVYVARLALGLRGEVADVAEAQGISVSRELDQSLAMGIVKPPAHYSTLQDLEAGRHTEVDLFAGAVVELGQQYGIPTPYCEFVLNAIHALEEKNDGKFDYAAS